jgi:hypothetical protein
MAYDENEVRTESTSVRFEPELLGRFWQHNTTRLARANERILNGILAAASRELQLVQDLTRYSLDRFNKLSEVARPEKVKTEGEQNVVEFEHILAGFREITDEIWKSFGDASKLLLEGALTEAQDVASETVHRGARQAQAVADRTAKSIKSASESAKSASESIRN